VLAKRQKELRTGPTPPVAEIVVRGQQRRRRSHPMMDVNDLRRWMIETISATCRSWRATPAGVISFLDVACAVLEEQS
jgi:hypothetical protein